MLPASLPRRCCPAGPRHPAGTGSASSASTTDGTRVSFCHERQAWVDTVLDNPAGPDLNAYLDRVLSGRI